MSTKGWIALIFASLAAIWCAVAAMRKAAAMSRAAAWPAVRGTVTKSELYKDPERNNATHFRVEYSFALGDSIVSGASPRLSGDWFWSGAQQAAFVARFPEGNAVDVFYDPNRPTRNCLDRSDRSGITALLVLAFIAACGASLIAYLHAEELGLS